MKQLLFVSLVLLISACGGGDKEKKMAKKTEQSIQKIDSIENKVDQEIQQLETETKAAEEAINELDNI